MGEPRQWKKDVVCCAVNATVKKEWDNGRSVPKILKMRILCGKFHGMGLWFNIFFVTLRLEREPLRWKSGCVAKK